MEINAQTYGMTHFSLIIYKIKQIINLIAMEPKNQLAHLLQTIQNVVWSFQINQKRKKRTLC